MNFRAESYKKGFVLSFLFNFSSKLISFANNLIIAYYFGTTAETDIYFFLLGLIGVPVFFITSLTGTILIPEGMRRRNAGDLDHYFGLMNCFLYGYIALCLVIMALFAIFPFGTMSLFSQFSAATLHAHKPLILLAIPLIALNTISATFSDILISHKMFTIPSLSTVMNSILCIAFIMLFQSKIQVASVFMGTISATALQIVFQLYLLRRHIGWNFLIVKPAMRASLWKDIFFAQSGNLFTALIGYAPLYVLSTYENGVIAGFNYGQRVIDIVTNLIIIQFLNVLGIRLNQLLAENRHAELKPMFMKMVNSICLILVPLSLITALYSSELIRILFMRGKFDAHSVSLASQYLKIAVFMLPAAAVNGIVAKCFMAAQKIRRSFLYQMIMGVVMVLMIILFTRLGGPFGYPLSASFFWWINLFAMVVIMKRNFPEIHYLKAVRDIFLAFLYAVPALLPSLLLKSLNVIKDPLPACLVGGGVYCCVYLLVIKKRMVELFPTLPQYIGVLYERFFKKKPAPYGL